MAKRRTPMSRIKKLERERKALRVIVRSLLRSVVQLQAEVDTLKNLRQAPHPLRGRVRGQKPRNPP